MNSPMEIVLATKEHLLELMEQDRSYEIDMMYSISQKSDTFTISETKLEPPVVNPSENYKGPLECVEQLSDSNYMIYVARSNNETMGYCNAHWEFKSYGKKLVIDGIFSSKHARGRGVASMLVQKFIEIGKLDNDCLGVHVEMDTTKYHAIKMLLQNGFVFAGTEFYVWHDEAPDRLSKEVLYYYYKIRTRKV